MNKLNEWPYCPIHWIFFWTWPKKKKVFKISLETVNIFVMYKCRAFLNNNNNLQNSIISHISCAVEKKWLNKQMVKLHVGGWSFLILPAHCNNINNECCWLFTIYCCVSKQVHNCSDSCVSNHYYHISCTSHSSEAKRMSVVPKCLHAKRRGKWLYFQSTVFFICYIWWSLSHPRFLI